jgi:16S rRNA (uracil1498-N3)-methyltransferase
MSHAMAVPRLYIDSTLAEGEEIALDQDQARYLVQVLRLKTGAEVRVFNARDGEWRGSLAETSKKGGRLTLVERLRPPARPASDLHLLFAPVKRARTDIIVEKATELGVQAIRPVTTRRSIAERVRTDRFALIAREAAEQSERLDAPAIAEPEPLARVLDRWAETDGARRLLFLDEAAGGEGSPWRRADADAPPALEALRAAESGPEHEPWAVLIGPEGGFDPEERERLRGLPFVTAASLGPRILRADTAAIAALTLWQAILGDWS